MNKEEHHQHNNGDGFIVSRQAFTKVPQGVLQYRSVKFPLATSIQGRDPDHKMLSKWSELKKVKLE